jgi:hypothetical protein
MKHQAIYNLYPSVKRINEDDNGVLTILDINNEEVSINESDVETKRASLQTAEDNKVTAKATAKTSGNTKLLGLGLTQEEATALTGYTPE